MMVRRSGAQMPIWPFLMVRRSGAFLLAFLIGCLGMRAVEADSVVRPVASTYTLGLGSAHLCDTYLTPLKYSGWSATLNYERLQAMRHNPRRNIMRLDLGARLSRTLNPAKSAAMWQIDFEAAWSIMWRYRPVAGLTLAGGGNVQARLGALSLMRNGNNPVAAKAAANVGVTGMAAWQLGVAKLPVTLRLQPTMPLLGAFFSPDYDELYYEIWLGNHSGLCHFAWPGSYFAINNLLSADLHFGATTLRLGYRLDYRSTKTSGIVSRDICHMLVIGISTEWISLRSGLGHTPDARVVSALY